MCPAGCYDAVVADTPRKRRTSRLRNDSRGEKVAVYLPPEVVTELKVRCAVERRSLSDAVSTAVQAWLKRRRRQGDDLAEILVSEG